MLLRPGEMLAMRTGLFNFLSKDLMSVKVWGKNSARTGEWESVLLKDPVLIQIIVNKQKAGEDYLFNSSSYAFNNFYREAVDHYRVEHRKPTPRGVRRGGAGSAGSAGSAAISVIISAISVTYLSYLSQVWLLFVFAYLPYL